jgi:hypothetical protein
VVDHVSYVPLQLSEAKAKGDFVKKAFKRKTWWGTGRWVQEKQSDGSVKDVIVMGQKFMDWINGEADKNTARCLDATTYT